MHQDAPYITFWHPPYRGAVHIVQVDDPPYRGVIERVEPTTVPLVIPTDPDDDQVIAAAIAAHANFIVSGDHHLLDLGRFQNIRILRTAQAVAEIEALR